MTLTYRDKRLELLARVKYPGAKITNGQLFGCRGGDGIIRSGESVVLCKDCGVSPCEYDIDYNVGKICSGCVRILPPNDFETLNSRYCIECLDKRKWAAASIRSHKKCGYDVQFTVEELYSAVKTGCHCFLCGVELDFSRGKGLKINSPTVDRVHNERVMNIRNVEILCHQCNLAKGKFALSTFVERCRRVVEVHAMDEVSA